MPQPRPAVLSVVAVLSHIDGKRFKEISRLDATLSLLWGCTYRRMNADDRRGNQSDT